MYPLIKIKKKLFLLIGEMKGVLAYFYVNSFLALKSFLNETKFHIKSSGAFAFSHKRFNKKKNM